MMRETFRRVAEEVVMPLAEEVHRHDLDIPATIIDQLKELGCFGISYSRTFWRDSKATIKKTISA